jgi:hypothetical protein
MPAREWQGSRRRCRRRRRAGPWHASSGWAGSPAASSPTAPRPNAPSPWPSGWAASMPPPSWAPPGRRCAKPSPATVCDARPHPEAVRQRVIAAARRRSGQPATPTLDPVFVASTPAPCRRGNGRRPSCMRGFAGRRSMPSWAPAWSSSYTAKATRAGQLRAPGRSSAAPNALTATQRPSRPFRAPAGRPYHPQRPHQPIPPTPGAWDDCRCPLIRPRPENSRRRRTARNSS